MTTGQLVSIVWKLWKVQPLKFFCHGPYEQYKCTEDKKAYIFKTGLKKKVWINSL